MDNFNLIAHPWKDYELIDSGDNRKLERYGEFIVIRPETQAIWKPGKPDEWKKAKAEFRWFEGKGVWSKKDMPESWELSWEDVRFSVMLTSFKHTGIFPEQVPNWEWLKKKNARAQSSAGFESFRLYGHRDHRGGEERRICHPRGRLEAGERLDQRERQTFGSSGRQDKVYARRRP